MPNGISIGSAVFAGYLVVTFQTDRQTDRPTDRPTDHGNVSSYRPHLYATHIRCGLIMDITSLLQQNRLRWYVRVLRTDDWVKKCMEYEVLGSRPRGRPKRTWFEVVQRDCQVR